MEDLPAGGQMDKKNTSTVNLSVFSFCEFLGQFKISAEISIKVVVLSNF